MTQPLQSTGYTFGNTDLAARRLQLLANAFEPSTREFLLSLRSREPVRIADLGCGPGATTRLLADVFPDAHVVGLDNSESFLALARRAAKANTTFDSADVTQGLLGSPYDLIYARYLLTHLNDARGVVLRWGAQLTRSGVIALEENEWIETDQPAFRQYLSIVEAMLNDSGQKLYVGADLEALSDWHPLSKCVSELVPVVLADHVAAELFVPNLQTWRERDFIQRNYDSATLSGLESDLKALAGDRNSGSQIVFGRRRMVLGRQSG